MVPPIPSPARVMAHARGDSLGSKRNMRMALTTDRWTRADLERLPDDGNKYEVIHGELLVSPAPRPAHERIIHALRRALEVFCDREQIGHVYDGKPAFVTRDSEVLPDIVVRQTVVPPPDRWDDEPTPLLIVEVLSESTRRTDLIRKRAFYIESGIPEYWIVDGEARTIQVVRAEGDRIETATLRWQPAGASTALDVDIRKLFDDALGAR
jgi:Uma2 family endonuclease